MGFLGKILQIPQRFFSWWRQTYRQTGLFGKMILAGATILFACCFCTFSILMISPNSPRGEEEVAQATVETSRHEEAIEPEDREPAGEATLELATIHTPVPTATHEPTATRAPTETIVPAKTSTAPPPATETIVVTPTNPATSTTAPAATILDTEAPGLSWEDGRLEENLSQLNFETYYVLYNPDNQILLVAYHDTEPKGDICSYPFEMDHRAAVFFVKSLLEDGYPEVERVFLEQVDTEEVILSRLTWVPTTEQFFYEGPDGFLEMCR